MDKTKVNSIESLTQLLRSKEDHLTHIEISSIVNGKVLSSYQTIATITGALLTEFPGYYKMKSGIDGNLIFDGKGIILNLNEYSQFFIDENAKIEGYAEEENPSIVDIKDVRSSMYVKLQIFNDRKDEYNAN